MSYIVEAKISPKHFILQKTLKNSDILIEGIPTISTNSGPIPYLKIQNIDRDRLEKILGQEKLIDNYKIIDKKQNEYTISIDWGKFPKIIELINEFNAALLKFLGDRTGWNLKLGFEGQRKLTDFFDMLRNQDIQTTIEQTYTAPLNSDRNPDLTTKQLEILEAALNHGYFDIPRKITTSELADKTGISDAAVGQRMRRGLKTILENHLK